MYILLLCCRSFKCRFSEHHEPYHVKQYYKSTAADQLLNNKHKFAGFRLLIEINNIHKLLNAYENVPIYL